MNRDLVSPRHPLRRTYEGLPTIASNPIKRHRMVATTSPLGVSARIQHHVEQVHHSNVAPSTRAQAVGTDTDRKQLVSLPNVMTTAERAPTRTPEMFAIVPDAGNHWLTHHE